MCVNGVPDVCICTIMVVILYVCEWCSRCVHIYEVVNQLGYKKSLKSIYLKKGHHGNVETLFSVTVLYQANNT